MKREITKFAVLASALALMLGGGACGREKTTVSAAPESVSGVETMTVERGSIPSYYEAVGTVRATQSAQLSAQVMGNVLRVYVREGDRVSKGQVLAVIDDSQTSAALDGASAGRLAAEQEMAATEAEFGLAEATMKRYQALFEKRSVSPHEFDEVKTRFEGAKARRELARAGRAGAEASVARARSSQGFTQVRAPFAGMVTAKLAEAGNLAAPGTPLLVVEDTSSFRLEATVDERWTGTVRMGEQVPVVVDAIGDAEVKGKIVQILPAADAGSRTFLVKVDLPKNAAIRSGLFGRARFPVGRREGLAIPQSAVVQRGMMQAVYVLGEDKIASLRYVTLGSPEETKVEVLSGLSDGERIVAKPGARELNGKKIEVR